MSLQASGSPKSQASPGNALSTSSQLSAASGGHVTAREPASRTFESQDESIDAWPSKTAFLLGDTGESDPYLLRRFSTERTNQDDASKVTCRHMFRTDQLDGQSTERPLVMSVADHSLYDHGEPRVADSVLQGARIELETLCSEEVGVRLIKLFFKYVYPYFPILSRSRLLFPASEITSKVRGLALSLKAALYAAGLPFFIYDDVLATTLVHSAPSARDLYRISWLAVTHEIHTPHLSTLQSCLLLLQRVNDDRYVMDTVFRWSLLAWTVSLAQSLGLSADCCRWVGIPEWEKRLRRRLWWALFVSTLHDFERQLCPFRIAVSPQYKTLTPETTAYKDSRYWTSGHS